MCVCVWVGGCCVHTVAVGLDCVFPAVAGSDEENGRVSLFMDLDVGHLPGVSGIDLQKTHQDFTWTRISWYSFR